MTDEFVELEDIEEFILGLVEGLHETKIDIEDGLRGDWDNYCNGRWGKPLADCLEELLRASLINKVFDGTGPPNDD